MNVTVSVNQLEKNLPEILNRTVTDDDICVIERNGENIAVIVSLREWKRRTVGEQLDALGNDYKLSTDKQRRTEKLLSKEHLNRTEEAELEALLREADDILLRRAEALDKL